ncbi:hypothetical protein YC2023_084878 [Brassica napus]
MEAETSKEINTVMEKRWGRSSSSNLGGSTDSGFTGGIEKWTEHCRPMGMNHRKDGVEFGSMGKRVVEVGRK